MSKFVFMIVLIVLYIQDINAREVEYDFIEANSYHIQVGAFGSSNNVNRVKNKLNTFDIYVEPYKNLNRVIVVNIMTEEQLKVSFSKIKKLYPNAFISKRVLQVTKSNDNDNYEKPVENYNQLFEPPLRKREIIQQYNDTLNSNTILKTRKSFL